jgi:hypothetical protein
MIGIAEEEEDDMVAGLSEFVVVRCCTKVMSFCYAHVLGIARTQGKGVTVCRQQ